MTKMIEQMGEATANGEVNSVDKGWPPKSLNQTMQKQMGEDRGNIDALMRGRSVYDPSTVTGKGEGKDITPNEKSMYTGDSTHVPGGTAGFKGVPDVFEPVKPYPEVADVYARENVHSGFWSKDVIPVTEAPGNSKVVGDMVTGMPKDGTFSGPARIGPGNMVSDYEPGEARSPGAEDTFEASLVGDIATGMPTDGFPKEEHVNTEVSPEGLTTGNTEGAYAPGLGKGTGRGVNGGQ